MRGDSTARSAPLDPSYAALAIEDASDREQVFGLLLRAVRSTTKFAALVMVHGDHLRGRRASADEGFDASHVDALKISRGAVPAFEAAIEAREASVGTLATGEPFIDGLLDQLGGPSSAAIVLPIVEEGETVALVIGHRGLAALQADDLVELLPLLTAATIALERVREVRTRAATSTKLIKETGYEIEVIVHDVARRRLAIGELRAKQAWPELADALRDLAREGIAKGDPDEDEQLELFLELARVEDERLGRLDRAIEAWRSALTIDATDVRALDGLGALLVRHERWRETVELLDKRVALTEDVDQRSALLVEVAKLSRTKLDDDEAAIAAYERILNWQSGHEVARRELEALYAAREQWEPMATLLLDRAAGLDDDAQRAEALASAARLYEDKVGDPRAAFLVRLAMLRAAPDRVELADELARLAPLARAWNDVIAEGSTLAEELEPTAPRAAGRLWHLVGSWQRERGNHGEASRAFEHAFRIDPANAELVPDLLASLRASGRWSELAALLAHQVEAEPDHDPRSALCAELGELMELQFGKPAEAITWYQRALADEPEAEAALEALHRLYRKTERWTELGDLLPCLIAVLDPKRDRSAIVALHLEHGRVLAEHLARGEDAVRAYTAVLELEPRHPVAFDGIARVYQATGQTEALLEAREAALDAETTEDRPYGDLATAWHQRGRFDRAIALWRKTLAIDPENAAGLDGLSRAQRDSEDWSGLAATLRARLELATEPATRVSLLVDLGRVLDERLDDASGAAVAYRAAIEARPDLREVVDALARLHERADQHAPALERLHQLLELTTAAKPRADIFQRIGQVCLSARDPANARLALVQAIALDVDNADALEGMARLHLMQDEVVAAGEELLQAARASTNDDDRIRRFADAAWIFRHRLHDAERARQCLHIILDLEPEHGDAKQALAELLADTQQWESLWPHLEQELERVEQAGTPAERVDVYTRAARCALELDKFDRALGLYDLASELDKSPALMLERADAIYRSRALDAAAASYQTLVLVHTHAFDRDQLVRIYRRLAEIQGALGRVAQAQQFHVKVLELDPEQRETLEELAELQQARGRFDEAITSLRSVLDLTVGVARVALLEKIGDLYRDKLRNLPKAMSHYLEALELEAGNRRLLQRMLDLQTEAGQWRAAVETIGRFLDHETDPARRGAYCIAEAEIRRTELRDKPGALEAYERALDSLFEERPLGAATRGRGIEALRIIDELLAADQDWKRLEQVYRRMIKRVPKEDPLALALWHALGELYRSRLDEPATAIEAFEVAHALDPDKTASRATILTELYARVGKAQPQHVSERAAKLVEADPDHSGAYRAIGHSSLETGRFDEAWCVARALVFMKKANAEEQALYQRFRAQEVQKATGILDEDSWSFVRHPDEDRTISAIFALAWQAPVALYAGPVKSFDLKPKDRMPVEDGTRVIAKIFRHASRVLNVAMPEVYVDARRSGRLLLANCIERGRLQPTVIVGRDLMTGYRDTEIASAVGAMLALLQPAYYLKLALPSVDELEATVAAAAELVGRPGMGRPELEPLRTQFVAEMQQRLTRRVGEALHTMVARLPAELDLARWRNTVDTTAQRAGLLVGGELAAAARMIATEATSIGARRPLERVSDLVSYSVSASYFAARAHLGVCVGR